MHVVPSNFTFEVHEHLHFGGNEEFLSWDPALSNGLCDSGFGAVSPCGINVTITSLQSEKGSLEKGPTLSFDRIPSTESNCRHFMARRELKGRRKSHFEKASKSDSQFC